MLKAFNCSILDTLALGYSSHFFLTDLENFKKMKHLSSIVVEAIVEVRTVLFFTKDILTINHTNKTT